VSEGEQVLFSIGEVAAIVGLSRHTIRAWERRHQLQPRRTPTGQRRYTADDVALLLQVKDAVARHRLSLKLAFGAAQGDLRPAAEEPGWSPGIWRSIADLLPEMIFVLDTQGVVHTGNRAASDALGLPVEEMAGHHLAELLERGLEPGEVREILRRARVQRTRFELELPTISGLRRWTFECRPVNHQGRPHLVLIARPALGGPAAGLPRSVDRRATSRQ
jgi:PAS domain S-box-containing protein